MFNNQINSPFRTPTNSVQQPLNISSGSPPNIQRLGFFNAVSSLLSHELLNQSGSSSSFFEVQSLGSFEVLSVNTLDTCTVNGSPEGLGEPPRTPLRLGAPVPVLFIETEGDQRVQLRKELSSWANAAGSQAEIADRQGAAVNIIACFHNKWPTLAINSPSITNLPACIGFLGHLKTLDLSNCSALGSLPNVLAKFTNLYQLNLTNCQNLTALPPSVNELPGSSCLFLKGSGIDIANPLQSRLPNAARLMSS